jgi:hypothetical protein
MSTPGALFLRSSRYLLLNNPEELTDLQQTLATILGNITDNPAEAKFRSLRLSNKLVQNKIATRKGGFEFLNAIGFEMGVNDGGEKVLHLPESVEIASLQLALSWLNDNVATCLQYAAARSFPSSSFAAVSAAAAKASPCAECTIQIKLPTGASVAGGFARTEPVSAVLDFAKTFFALERTGGSVLLRAAHDASVLCGGGGGEGMDDGADGAVTVEQAGLFPRALLICSTQSDDERGALLQKTKAHVKEEVKKNAVSAEQLKQKKLAEFEAKKREKERALLAFRDDREERKDRAALAGGGGTRRAEAGVGAEAQALASSEQTNGNA